MQKTLVIYSLNFTKQKYHQLSLLENYEGEVNLKTKIMNFVQNHTEDELLVITNPSIFEIITVSESHIFGSYGLMSNTTSSPLIRSRNKDNFEEQDIEVLIENFTYFYLDVDRHRLIVMKNSHCKNFNKNFGEFLLNHFKLTSIYEKIDVHPLLADDIKNRVGNKTSIKKLKLKYIGNNLPQNGFISFDDMVVNSAEYPVKSASIDITFEEESNKKGITLHLSKMINSIFNTNPETFIVNTIDEDFDLVEQSVAKKVTLTIDKDDFNHWQIIENLLQRQLEDSF